MSYRSSFKDMMFFHHIFIALAPKAPSKADATAIIIFKTLSQTVFFILLCVFTNQQAAQPFILHFSLFILHFQSPYPSGSSSIPPSPPEFPPPPSSGAPPPEVTLPVHFSNSTPCHKARVVPRAAGRVYSGVNMKCKDFT